MTTSPPVLYSRPVRWALYFLVIGMALAIVAAFMMVVMKQPPQIVDVTVNSSVAGKKEHVSLPYLVMGEEDEKLDFTIVLRYKPGQATIFYVVPDDCVDAFTVNREKVKLSQQANDQRCNYQTGFSVNLEPYLEEGDNHVYIQVRNKNGKTGLRFSTDMDTP